MGEVYYNEIDDYNCQWMQDLIDRGELPAGRIDNRSIADVSAVDLVGYDQCHFFAGIGGWALSLRLAGCDRLKCWTGSCPCQPFSKAGKGLGTKDPRHLWPVWRRLGISYYRETGEVIPAIFGEQVASPAGREWFSRVRSDLARMGYDAGGADLCAAGVSAPHIRQRIFWMAYAASFRAENEAQARISVISDEIASRPGPEWEGASWRDHSGWDMSDARRRCEPGALQVVNGVSEELDTIKGYGNAIVPELTAIFIQEAVGAVADCQAH